MLEESTGDGESRTVSDAVYDRLGRGYGRSRQADPRIAARIEEALGSARAVINVGAGTGSYEPAGLEVTAVEPSAAMIAQRPPGLAPAIQATAEALPFEDESFDVAMAVLSAHHWSDLRAGLEEMLRVARQRVVVVAFDAATLEGLWIAADYFPDILELKRPAGADSGSLVAMLPKATASPIPVPRDCRDHFFAALWARPELLFDEELVRPMWVWQSIPERSRLAGRERLAADLESGEWDRRYGHLRERRELDVGLRLVVSELG